MQVQLVLKSWKIIQDNTTKLPKVCGRYAVMMGEKEIANQEFNDGYNSKEIPFSGEITQAIMNTENIIRAELERLLT